MSPHVEYWGIPSPTEVICSAPESESLPEGPEDEITDRSLSSARDTESGERDTNFMNEA